MASWYRDELKIDAIPIDDRGLQYSDGLFETIAIRDGKPRLWVLHSDRLQTGCRRLGIRLPSTDELLHGLTSAVRADGKVEDDALLKIIVTRGEGDRGYAPPPNSGTTILFGVFERTRTTVPAGCCCSFLQCATGVAAADSRDQTFILSGSGPCAG